MAFRASTPLIPRAPDALRRNNFDAIRLAMAVTVVWSHSFALWRGSEADEPVSRLMSGTYNAGNMAVLAFFVISGFLITLSWLRARSWQAYLHRRVARIYPGYLVATLLCSLLVVPALADAAVRLPNGAEIGGLLSNLLLRNYIVGDAIVGPVNGSLWSIPYEFWCYLGVMALGLTGLLRHRRVYPLAAALIILVRIWLDLTGRRPGGWFLEPIIGFAYFWFNVAPPFLLGGAIFLYRDRIPRSRTLLAALIGATVLIAHLPVPAPLRLVATRTVFPAALAYAVLYAAFAPRLRLHQAARFGDFSFGAYLYAFPIQRLLVHFGKGHISFPAFVALSIGASLLAGIVSWHLVERWFLPRFRHGAHPQDRATHNPAEQPHVYEGVSG